MRVSRKLGKKAGRKIKRAKSDSKPVSQLPPGTADIFTRAAPGSHRQTPRALGRGPSKSFGLALPARKARRFGTEAIIACAVIYRVEPGNSASYPKVKRGTDSRRIIERR